MVKHITHDEMEHLSDVVKTMISVETVYMHDKGDVSSFSAGKDMDYEGISRIRRRTCSWMYMVVDHYEYERETATIAMSFYDCYNLKKRYKNWVNDRSRLGAISSLYLAVKLNERQAKDPISQFTLLGNDQFSKQDIIQMETELLFVLSWKMHPPTPQAFIRNFFQIFDYSIPHSFFSEVYTMANYITELSTFNFDFAFINPSTIGYASIMLALNRTNQNVFQQNLNMILRQLHSYDLDVSLILNTFVKMNKILHSTLIETTLHSSKHSDVHEHTRSSHHASTPNTSYQTSRICGYVSSDDDDDE